MAIADVEKAVETPRQLKAAVGLAVEVPQQVVKRGDLLPSSKPVMWSASKTKKHDFDTFATVPQQDVEAKFNRIYIHPETDRRAQPWTQFIRANIHDYDVDRLPPITASELEVREWLYYVLTQKKCASFADTRPAAICSTLIFTCVDGQKLREMSKKASWDICPEKYRDVDSDFRWNSRKARKEIHATLATTIRPLLKAEMKASKKAAKCKETQMWNEKDGIPKVSSASCSTLL